MGVPPRPLVTGRFSGFPPKAIDFFKDLERHNKREWFLAHKEIYERACREPMEQLVAELEPQFGKSRISRIYRDIRFSENKQPYKTHVAASFWPPISMDTSSGWRARFTIRWHRS